MSDICNACSDRGQCCTYVELPRSRILTSDEKRWVELHGIRLVQKGEAVWAYVPTACSQLQEDNTCGIYETRPDVCRTWPTSQADIDELHEWVGEEVCTVA